MTVTENKTLTAVKGVLVGHYTDKQAKTGCSVILSPDGATAGVDVRGGAPGTREIALLNPVNTVSEVHGILLTGGSAYGLAAADGVMRWLEAKGIGFNVGVGVVPIVPAAVLFDLTSGQADIRPDAQAGYEACEAASRNPVQTGRVGAGTGATVGKLYGPGFAGPAGLGSAVTSMHPGITVGAMVAVNAFGNIVDPNSGEILAGARNPMDGAAFVDIPSQLHQDLSNTMLGFGQNTTIAVIATDAVLTKAEATKVAQMAHNGLARTIRPVHTPLDGDTIFVLATGKTKQRGNIAALGSIAADILAEAVVNVGRD